MKQISLRLPDDLHARIKRRAERERRSLHAEILHIIEAAGRHTPRPDLVVQDDEAAGPEDVTGRHALDGEPTDIPVSQFDPPSPRYRGGIEE